MLGWQWSNRSRTRSLARFRTRPVPDGCNRGGGSNWTATKGGCSGGQRDFRRIDRAASELRTRPRSLTRDWSRRRIETVSAAAQSPAVGPHKRRSPWLRRAPKSTRTTPYMARSPELYQEETLLRLRGTAEVSAAAYIEATHSIERLRRAVKNPPRRLPKPPPNKGTPAISASSRGPKRLL